ncbi:MAG: Mur ligase family protein, partial [Planctomycetota bacterium]
TTGMLAHALLAGGVDPSFVVGATVPQLGGGSRSGHGPHFVAEACEYDRSFLHLRPAVAVITNVEADHLDCYGNLDNIKTAFRAFADLTPDDSGAVIANADDAHSRSALAGRSVTWVGQADDAAWSWINATVDAGCWRADIVHHGEIACGLRLSVPGKHNLYNAVMAIAAAAACGMEPRVAAEHISTFRGADRRMTHLGRVNESDVVDDYGHHPTEIAVTLDALRQRYRPRRLICVFQPHQHSRTRQLLADFARCFTAADEVVLPDVYSVRDDPEDKFVGSDTLAEEIAKTGHTARHIGTFADCDTYLRNTLEPGDLCVTMGAGDVHVIGEGLVGNAE